VVGESGTASIGMLVKAVTTPGTHVHESVYFESFLEFAGG
jgi:hypothetical protein